MSFWGGGFPGGSVVKNLPAVQETQVQTLGGESPPEKGSGYLLHPCCTLCKWWPVDLFSTPSATAICGGPHLLPSEWEWDFSTFISPEAKGVLSVHFWPWTWGFIICFFAFQRSAGPMNFLNTQLLAWGLQLAAGLFKGYLWFLWGSHTGCHLLFF